MPGNLDMENLTAGVTDHEEGIEGLEAQCLDTEEVTGPDLCSVPFEKGSPAGRWFAVMPNAHVLGNGSRRDRKSQPRQLRLDSPLTPQDVLRGHAAYKQSEFVAYRAPPTIKWRTRPPTPIRLPSLPMPGQDRFGLHDEQRLTPVPEPATSQ